MLTINQATKVDVLKQGSHEFATMRRLAIPRHFAGPVNSASSTLRGVNSGLVAITRFGLVLRRNVDAVRDAIEMPWKNGQAEGLINRLKTIKRTIRQSGLRAP
ncbi:hypothetical protein [Mesorhizobium sp. M0187]|uniref:hypothetical protein n=1 Tax=Mesorhizobium sp. M0187 TaxID=2956908 RepID=UPI0033372B2D